MTLGYIQKGCFVSGTRHNYFWCGPVQPSLLSRSVSECKPHRSSRCSAIHVATSVTTQVERLSCDDSGAPMTGAEYSRRPGGAATTNGGLGWCAVGLDCRQRLIRTGLPASGTPRSRDNPTRRMEMNWKWTQAQKSSNDRPANRVSDCMGLALTTVSPGALYSGGQAVRPGPVRSGPVRRHPVIHRPATYTRRRRRRSRHFNRLGGAFRGGAV